jgi:DNA-binding transcriptional LysR family regulator
MNLTYIHEFVLLTQIKKYQEAADQLFITQPTLSKHMMTLEKELGNDLIARSKKNQFQLTAFGKNFLSYALQLDEIYNEMQSELLSNGGSKSKHIVIGASPIVPLYTVFTFLDRFMQEHPEYSLEVIDAPQYELYDLLRTGQCNLIVVQEYKETPSEDFHQILYAQDELAVMMPKDHPLAGKESVSMEDLKDEHYIFLSRSPLASMTKDLANAHGFVPHEQITVGRPSAVVDLVANHMGISIMPKFPATHYAGTSALVVDLEPLAPITYKMFYPRSHNLPDGTKQLLEYVSKKSL